MLARLQTYSLFGIEAVPVDVEVDVSGGALPATVLVGMPDAAIRESTHRVARATGLIRMQAQTFALVAEGRAKKGDVIGVKESMLISSEQGIQNFDTALLRLFKSGRIDLDEALSNADSRTNLEARINFG